MFDAVFSNPAYADQRAKSREHYAKVEVLLKQPTGTEFTYSGSDFLDDGHTDYTLKVNKSDDKTQIIVTEERNEQKFYPGKPKMLEKEAVYTFNHLGNLVGVEAKEHGHNVSHSPSNLQKAGGVIQDGNVAKQAMDAIIIDFDRQLAHMGDAGNDYIKQIDAVLTGRSFAETVGSNKGGKPGALQPF